jgi:rhodanese-related sulfurtransferase
MTPVPLSVEAARRRLADGALLVDVREPDEHARVRIPGAQLVPLGRIGGQRLGDAGGVVFHCRSGARTCANAERLAAAAAGPAWLLDGGIEAWERAGLPVVRDLRAPLELMRQVQIVAGLMVLTGVVLAWLVAPPWLGLAGFVGAGLLFAGITGWCGMARLLALMPWNRRTLDVAPANA